MNLLMGARVAVQIAIAVRGRSAGVVDLVLIQLLSAVALTRVGHREGLVGSDEWAGE